MPVKKALLVTTVSGFVPQFEMNNVRLLQELGYEVHYASNYETPSYGEDNHRLDGTGIVRHQIDFVRSPFRIANLKVYRQLCGLMRRERFDLVHCHTPMGSVMARYAAHATHTGPVIYTAHGFHFFQGAPLMNWLCYYPMERFLSRYTDRLICINQEDYQRAKKSFHARKVSHIPGEGIDLTRVSASSEKAEGVRQALGLPKDGILILSVGELIERKNYETALRTIANLRVRDVRYVVCGHGRLDEYLKGLATGLGVADRISFLGYREDIMDIYASADLFLFPSTQEGLPMALLEAMASGLPIVCSDIRGNRDLMGEEERTSGALKYCAGGIMVRNSKDADGFAKAIREMLAHHERWERYGEANRMRSREFALDRVEEKMRNIYREC